MEKKMIKKLLAIMMTITILATDFFVLGSGLISYAVQLNNEIEGYPNIYFSTYFKEGENEVKQVNKSIKDKNLKLYAKIGVNSNVDYLEDIQIELKNSDFNIISSKQGSREGNIVKLDYIGAGSSVEIELDIEPILSNKISADMLLKTNVELTAKYKHADAPEGETIKATSESSVKYQPDEATEAELETQIITNKVLAVDGENKKIIQLLIKSRLANNEYPVEQTTLNVSIPQLSKEIEEVNVMAIGQLATNGLTEINSDNYTVDGDKLQIILKNEIDTNNEISWVKDAYDELVVTFIYPEIISSTHISTGVNSEIKVYGNTETYTKIMAIGLNGLEQPNSVIMGRTEITTEEMYKGKLYANLDAEYNTKTKLIVTKENIVDEIKVEEGPDAFGTAESELLANTKYITTEINLNKMLKILGTDGILTIKNGNTITTINKDTAVDEKGNVVINHENGTSILEITTSKPEKAGVLEINHTKAITGNTFTREQLKTVKALNVKNTTSATLEGTEIVKESTGTKTLELKETISKAELTIENNKETLSTTEANEITLGITLITDGTQYDLYKNPEITIQMPEVVENVEFTKPTKQNADEFEISANYDSNTRTFKISLIGEQTVYPESELTQAYLQLNLKVTLSQLVATHTNKITMTYTNENATQYDGGTTDVGIFEKTIQIEAQSGVLKMFNMSLNDDTSLNQNITQQITEKNAGADIVFETILINNTDSNMNNVRILGKLPTTGNTIKGEEINSLETTLESITAENVTVYYTENVNATVDKDDTANGWTTDSTNAKMYLIEIGTLAIGSKYTTSTVVKMPTEIGENLESYAQYEVIYDTETETNVTETSRIIGIVTSISAMLETKITAQVGTDMLNNGDTVKEGEVIKYTATVTNRSNGILENVQLTAGVPEGTVVVEPVDGYEYTLTTYYEEKPDIEGMAVANITLAPEEIYTMQYEVRVNEDITTGTEISNQAIAIHNNVEAKSDELKNILEESNIRVTIKRANNATDNGEDAEKIQLVAGGAAKYNIIIENLSNETIKDLNMQVITDSFVIEKLTKDTGDYISLCGDEVPKEISIKEISANDAVVYSISGNIKENIEKLEVSVIVTDSSEAKYRSNAITEYLPYIDASITLSSPQDKTYIKQEDIIEYTINIKNTGDIGGIVKVEDEISYYLEIQSISVNGEVKTQSIDATNAETYIQEISNSISYSMYLEAGQSAEIYIRAKVKYIPNKVKTITNEANVSVMGVHKATSEVITHKLMSCEDDELLVVIGGVAWLDTNGNGQQDNNETTFAGTKIKLYDNSTNSYVMDENGNIIELTTDNNGQYGFTKLLNGSYKIVLEYDTATYKLTTSLPDVIEIQDNTVKIDIGLKEIKSSENDDERLPDEQNPTEKPGEDQTEKPGEDQTEEPPVVEDKKSISGFAWLDEDRDGQKDDNETVLSGIKVKIYDISIANYLKDDDGNIIEATTDVNGTYKFENIEKGSYIILFEYDTEKYEPTTYFADGVDTSINSKVVFKKISINGEDKSLAVTDTINVQNDISNINIGLKEKLIFDLELNKYISRILVQTSKETKSYNYEDSTFEKVEIYRKQIEGAIVILEYTIEVKNTGEISGYTKNIVDYLPSGLTFSSELNTDWYLSGSYLYTKSLENVQLNPGEEKEIKLILTKTMTDDNLGLINNRAEIYQDYNKYADIDTDSTPNNQAQNEDDIGSADVIIMVSTGGSVAIYGVMIMLNMVLIGFAIRLMIKNRIIIMPKKRGRR